MEEFYRIRRLPPYVFQEVTAPRQAPAMAALISSTSVASVSDIVSLLVVAVAIAFNG